MNPTTKILAVKHFNIFWPKETDSNPFSLALSISLRVNPPSGPRII